jgi:hypothetical protein
LRHAAACGFHASGMAFRSLTRRVAAAALIWVFGLGNMAAHRAHAQPRAGKRTSVARRRIESTLAALEKVLRAVDGSHCRIPQDVEIRLSDRTWIVALEWEQPATSGEWRLDVDNGRMVHGACVSTRTREPVEGLLAFVRAARAATQKAPRYQSAPERFQIAVARLPGADAWQVDFFAGESAAPGSEMVLVDDKSFRVLETKLAE